MSTAIGQDVALGLEGVVHAADVPVDPEEDLQGDFVEEFDGGVRQAHGPVEDAGPQGRFGESEIEPVDDVELVAPQDVVAEPEALAREVRHGVALDVGLDLRHEREVEDRIPPEGLEAGVPEGDVEAVEVVGLREAEFVGPEDEPPPGQREGPQVARVVDELVEQAVVVLPDAPPVEEGRVDLQGEGGVGARGLPLDRQVVLEVVAGPRGDPDAEALAPEDGRRVVAEEALLPADGAGLPLAVAVDERADLQAEDLGAVDVGDAVAQFGLAGVAGLHAQGQAVGAPGDVAVAHGGGEVDAAQVAVLLGPPDVEIAIGQIDPHRRVDVPPLPDHRPERDPVPGRIEVGHEDLRLGEQARVDEQALRLREDLVELPEADGVPDGQAGLPQDDRAAGLTVALDGDLRDDGVSILGSRQHQRVAQGAGHARGGLRQNPGLR